MEQDKKDSILLGLFGQNQDVDSTLHLNLKYFLSLNFKQVLRYWQKHLAHSSTTLILEVFFLRILLASNLEKLIFEEKIEMNESFPVVFYINLFKKIIGHHPNFINASLIGIFLEKDNNNYLSCIIKDCGDSPNLTILNSFI
jgi:hypothetical protein